MNTPMTSVSRRLSEPATRGKLVFSRGPVSDSTHEFGAGKLVQLVTIVPCTLMHDRVFQRFPGSAVVEICSLLCVCSGSFDANPRVPASTAILGTGLWPG